MTPNPTALRLDQLQWAVSHNSYLVNGKPLQEGMPFDIGGLYQRGLRGIELDIVQHESDNMWSVSHGDWYSTVDKSLSSYLRDLQRWSVTAARTKAHDPIFIHLDVKENNVADTFPDELDKYIRDSIGEQQVWGPSRFWKGKSDLMQNAMIEGWPKVAELSNTFIFVLTGQPEPKRAYAVTAPSTRLGFADCDCDYAISTTQGSRIVLNAGAKLLRNGMEFGDWCSQKPAILWRTYYLAAQGDFNAVAGFGPHMVAIDDSLELPIKGFWANPALGRAPKNFEFKGAMPNE